MTPKRHWAVPFLCSRGSELCNTGVCVCVCVVHVYFCVPWGYSLNHKDIHHFGPARLPALFFADCRLRMTSPANTEGQNYQVKEGRHSPESRHLFTNLQYLLHSSFSPFIILIEKWDVLDDSEIIRGKLHSSRQNMIYSDSTKLFSKKNIMEWSAPIIYDYL